jgi:hypothetical protein
LQEYADLYPGRQPRHYQPAGAVPLNTRWGSGFDLGYRYSHKVS